MLDPNRQIYPQAPLKLVAFQMQFPQVPALDSISPLPAISEALRERYPILGPPPVTQLEFGPGAAQQRQRGTRFMNRHKTWTVSVTGDSIAVETSRYQRYERFSEQVAWVLAQVHEIVSFPAVTRLGLRYIDEIEVDDADEVPDWEPWINKDLLVGAMVGEYRTREYLTSLTLNIDTFRRINLRYGRVDQPVVDPNGVLRILDSPAGSYFLLDIDSFWEPSTDEFKEFHASEVLAVTEELHEPIRTIFERALTQQLRERFAATPSDEDPT